MKVYIISANWGQGGPGGIAKDLYYTLEENGHSVRFGYSREEIPDSVNSFRFGTTAGVYTHALLTRLTDRGGFYSRNDTKRLLADIRSFKPDVISIHNPLGYTLNIPMLMDFIDTAGIPAFYTLHDCWMFTGHCTTELCDRLAAGCGNCPCLREFPASLLWDNTKNNLRYKQTHFAGIRNLQFISCSLWMHDMAEKSYLCNYKNTVINNGIDITVFRPTGSDFRKKYRLENKKIILGVASVWSKRKGQEFFCSLADRLCSDRQIVLVGNGLSKETGSHSGILCLDATKDAGELAAVYSAADVFVNPTIGDNYPTVNLEALACGTPVVTFNTGGSGEMVGDCGIIVDKGSIGQLAVAIDTVLRDPVNREHCVEHARGFDKRIKYNEYIQLFQRSLV